MVAWLNIGCMLNGDECPFREYFGDNGLVLFISNLRLLGYYLADANDEYADVIFAAVCVCCINQCVGGILGRCCRI